MVTTASWEMFSHQSVLAANCTCCPTQ